MDIGNIKEIVCDRKKVGRYVASSPTDDEKDCLRRFFQDIQAGTRTVPEKDLGGQFSIYVCGHVLRVKFSPSDTMYVTDIRRGAL